MSLIDIIWVKKIQGHEVGAVSSVRRGYVNYLVRKGYALRKTTENMQEFEKRKSLIEKNESESKAQALSIKEKIQEKTLEIYVHADDNGNMYGSITSKELSNKIKDEYGVDVSKSNFLGMNRIKSVGDYKIQIELYVGIVAEIYLFLKNADK